MCLTTCQKYDCGHVVVVHCEKCPCAVAEKKDVCERQAMEILASVGPDGFNCRTCYPVAFGIGLERRSSH